MGKVNCENFIYDIESLFERLKIYLMISLLTLKFKFNAQFGYHCKKCLFNQHNTILYQILKSPFTMDVIQITWMSCMIYGLFLLRVRPIWMSLNF